MVAQTIHQKRPATRSRRLHFLAIAVLALLIGFGLFLAGAHLWAWHNYSAAEEALAIGDYQEAEKYLNRCLTFWSGNGQVHYWMARTARALGQFDKARHHLDKCQELDWSPSAIELEETLLRAQQGEFSELEETLIEWAKEDNESSTRIRKRGLTPCLEGDLTPFSDCL